MRRELCAVLIALSLITPSAMRAQRPLAERIKALGTRTVAFSTRARAETCGDGMMSYMDGVGGRQSRYFYGEYTTIDGEPSNGRNPGPCEKGPAHIVARVVEGQISWMRLYVGPLATFGDTITELGTVSTADARSFLEPIVLASDGRAALEGMIALVVVDSVPRWSILDRVARDSSRLGKYRRRAGELLARGASSTISPEPGVDEDVRSIRREAVYALARQEPRGGSKVVDLLQIAKSNPHRDARVAALYELGQTGDARALDLFSEMLRGR